MEKRSKAHYQDGKKIKMEKDLKIKHTIKMEKRSKAHYQDGKKI